MKSMPYLYLLFFLLCNLSCQEKNKTTPPSDEMQLVEMDKQMLSIVLLTDTITLDNELIEGVLENNTSSEFTFGEGYRLEYWNDSIWNKVIYPEDLVIHSIAYGLPAYGKANFKINLNLDKLNIKPGKYRLTKRVSTRFEVHFNVADSLNYFPMTQQNRTEEDGELRLFLSSDLLGLGVDSIPFSIINNLDLDVFPLEFYMLQYYDEAHQSWLDYYYRSYTPKEEARIQPGKSLKSVIHLNTKKLYRYGNRKDLYQNKYFLRPGLYRLYKDVQAYLSVEFYLSA